MPSKSGRHFLQIPGPTNVPDRVLRALSQPTMDHRGPEFAKLAKEVLGGVQGVFMTKSPVIIFPGSGTGAWEAALVNTLSPGDKALMFETGHFATLWKQMATRLGVQVDWVAGMFMLFRSEVFRSIGGFDEAYFLYYEDVDLCRRLHAAGKSVIYNPRVEVVHDARRGSRREFGLMRHHLASMLRYLLR